MNPNLLAHQPGTKSAVVVVRKLHLGVNSKEGPEVRLGDAVRNTQRLGEASISHWLINNS